MSSDKPPPSDTAGRRGARRPARTIDLKAEEIASSPIAASTSETQEVPQQPAEPATAAQQASEAPATAQVIVEEPSVQPAEPVSATSAQTESPLLETDTSGANPPPPPSEPSLNAPGSSNERPLLGLLRLIGAGAVGAALVLLAFFLWAPSSNRGESTTAFDRRLSQAEQRLAEIGGRPSAATIDSTKVDDLSSRLARLEATDTKPPTPAPDNALVNRIATLEGQLGSLDEKIGVVARRTDEIATIAGDARSRADAATAAVAALPKAPPPAIGRDEVNTLANRIATVEGTAKALEAELAKRAAEGGERAVRLALTAAYLQGAAERGDPFAKELAAAKALGADAKVLAPLEPFAQSGVPSAAALAQELAGLLPALRQASGVSSADGNFLGRLQANAEKLVRIRPTDETPGNDFQRGAHPRRAARGTIRHCRCAHRACQAVACRARPRAALDCQGRSAPSCDRSQPATSRPIHSMRLPSHHNEETLRMIRVVLYLVVVGLLAVGAAWLADRPGDVLITWQGRRIETSVMVLIMAVMAFATLAVMLWSIARAILRSPEIVSGYVRTRRGARGYLALSQGLIAIGSGDARAARKFADEAGRLAPDEPLTLLLNAQTAQLAGDRSAAERTFHAMAGREDTRLLGLHGLFIEAQRRDDFAAAAFYAEEAAKSTSAPAWAGQAVLAFRCAAADWTGALERLDRNMKDRLIDPTLYRRQRAVLLTAQARAAEEGDRDNAKALALEAVKLAPTLVPAAALAGRMLGEDSELRRAARIVEAAWKANPHPELAETYAHLRPGDSARDRLVRVQTLAEKAPGHVESALAVARAALDAHEFSIARSALAPLIVAPTQRTAMLMAELEKMEHATRVVRANGWRAPCMRVVILPDGGWLRFRSLDAGVAGHRPPRCFPMEGARRGTGQGRFAH